MGQSYLVLGIIAATCSVWESGGCRLAEDNSRVRFAMVPLDKALLSP